MRLLFLLIPLVLIALSGCAPMTALQNRGADASDNARAAAEFTLCKGITIGAWVREYGRTKSRADAWKTLCADTEMESTPTK